MELYIPVSIAFILLFVLHAMLTAYLKKKTKGVYELIYRINKQCKNADIYSCIDVTGTGEDITSLSTNDFAKLMKNILNVGVYAICGGKYIFTTKGPSIIDPMRHIEKLLSLLIHKCKKSKSMTLLLPPKLTERNRMDIKDLVNTGGCIVTCTVPGDRWTLMVLEHK